LKGGRSENLRLPYGKVPPETLKDIILRNLGKIREEVILGPALGEDGAVVKVGEKVIISSMDPITGAVERIGWLAVNINANDIATFGVPPSFFSSCILLPEGSTEEIVKVICEQIDLAAKKLGIAVIGGHSEVTPGLDRPIIVGSAIGVTEPHHYVTSGGARAGDKLILTKGAGIEGTAILAEERYDKLKVKLNGSLLLSAKQFYNRISVVEDAIVAFQTNGVTAMHDPTEGGVAGGIHEMADASKLGFKVFEDRIPVAPETLEICRFFDIDPFQLISSGALLISAKPGYAEKIIKKLLDHNIEAAVIGEFLEKPEERLLIRSDGATITIERPITDHLWLALRR
jgi:hydrogenase maturation factor